MDGWRYLFTISPYEDECDKFCWIAKESGIDLEFVSVIGAAIEKNYLGS
ncbi:hypothetical protein [Segetibacter koreensis]|nr:hypothetical protein [Segetibacter koreensis]